MKHRRKFQLSYADQTGAHRYYRPMSKAACLDHARRLLNKRDVAQVLIRQDLTHVKSAAPETQ
jgi:hypothetical protein